MKSQFNSKMSNSPFYVGPTVYTDSRDGWSFMKKEKTSYKFLTILSLVCLAAVIIAI